MGIGALSKISRPNSNNPKPAKVSQAMTYKQLAEQAFRLAKLKKKGKFKSKIQSDKDEFRQYMDEVYSERQTKPVGCQDSLEKYLSKNNEFYSHPKSNFRKYFNPYSDDPIERIEIEHALKLDLGYSDYLHFYYNILKRAVEKCSSSGALSVEDKMKIVELLKNDRFGIAVHEYKISDATAKHAKCKEGGLYTVAVNLPNQDDLLFFVKRAINPESWEKSQKVGEFLSKTNAGKKQPKLIHSDEKTRLLVYEHVDGKILYDEFRDASEPEKEKKLERVIDDLLELSYEATESLQHYNYNNSDGNKPQLSNVTCSESSLLRNFVIKADKKLEKQLVSKWSGEIPEKQIESLKQKHKCIEKLLEAYKPIAESLESEKQVFSHGDLHLGNIIWSEQGPKFIDWEDAIMAPRQFDLLKLLRKAQISKQTEERLIEYAFVSDKLSECRLDVKKNLESLAAEVKKKDNRSFDYYTKRLAESEQALKEAEQKIRKSPNYASQLSRFKEVYNQMEFSQNLRCAAKYLNYSDNSESKEHKLEMIKFASYYYTLALNYVRGKELEQRIKDVVEEVHNGMLVDLGDNPDVVFNPLESQSMSIFAKFPSVIERIYKKQETLKQKFSKKILPVAAAAMLGIASIFGIYTSAQKHFSDKAVDEIVAEAEASAELDAEHSKYIGKYADMYGIDAEILKATTAYCMSNNIDLNLGVVSQHLTIPEQYVMSVANKLHDSLNECNNDYRAALVMFYAGKDAVLDAQRIAITGRYTDIRKLPEDVKQKFAETMAQKHTKKSAEEMANAR
jgi:thiamine kinase-like enzyme